MAEAVPLGLHCPRLAGIPILILGSNTALFREDELPKQPEVKGAQQTSPDITAPALPEFVHSDKGYFSLSYSWKTLGEKKKSLSLTLLTTSPDLQEFSI